MNKERKLAHIVSYYLSRFDKEALSNLGYKTDKESFADIAAKLGVLPNYVKFRRDEFDVVHPHRLGWHKRKMSQSIINTINALQDIDEISLRDIVQKILLNEVDSLEDIERILTIFPKEGINEKDRATKIFVPRNITGRKAEEYFINYFHSDYNRIGEKLIDKRDFGCGYDFEIVGNNSIKYVEVKGVAAETGGILFTSKEWSTALEKDDEYYLCVVSDLMGETSISFLQNPCRHLNPKRNILQTIQISYSVSNSLLDKTLLSYTL